MRLQRWLAFVFVLSGCQNGEEAAGPSPVDPNPVWEEERVRQYGGCETEAMAEAMHVRGGEWVSDGSSLSVYDEAGVMVRQFVTEAGVTSTELRVLEDGRVVSSTVDRDSDGTADLIVSYRYDDEGRPVLMEQNETINEIVDVTQTWTWGVGRRLKSSTYRSVFRNDETTYVFIDNADGTLTRHAERENGWTATDEYDTLGRRVRREELQGSDRLLEETQWGDKSDRLEHEERVWKEDVLEEQRLTQETYDAEGRILSRLTDYLLHPTPPYAQQRVDFTYDCP